MDLLTRLVRSSRSSLAVAVLLVGWTGGARAQSEGCDRLRQAIAAAGRPDPQRSAQFVRAAQRQRAELGRTQAYADQIGCSHGFSIFGNSGPPQCDSIETQIDRMTANLTMLQQQIAQFEAGDPDRQAALTEQYRTSCTADPSSGLPPDAGYGDGQPGFDATDGDASGVTHASGKAICVRTCDGGYFPLSFAPADRTPQGLQNLCTALCPNTEAKVYTTPDMNDVGASVALDGTPYTALPAAFKFQKTFDAACTCKPANKTWVEALADAETLLDKSGKDVTVTSKMSDDMARPVTPAAPGTPAQPKRKFNKADIKALLKAQRAADAALGAGAPVPAAGADPTGIDGAERNGGALRRQPAPNAGLRTTDEGF